jgi:hypothetical protein
MLAQEDPALKQMLAQEDQPSPDADGNTEQFSFHTSPANTQDQFLTAEDRITMTEEEILDNTCDPQMTITSTELFGGGNTLTLQEGQHERHQGEESQVYVELLEKPTPDLQMVDAIVNDADKVGVDVDDNPWDDMSVDNNSTAGETATSNPGGETSTNLGGGFENDKAILATIQDELIRLGAMMTTLETNQSNLLTRFLELDTKPPPVKTTEHSDPVAAYIDALTETTTHEPCANTAIAAMTDYEASKMAMTWPEQPEVIREIFKRQNMNQTKASTMMPKNRGDQAQWIQLMRRLNETVDDKYNETTTVIKIKTHLYNEDSVTFRPLRLTPVDKPLDQSQKYEQTSVETKPHTNRVFIQDTFHYLTITQTDISISMLDEYDAHPRIAVGKK